MTTKKILSAYKNANRDAVVESEDPQALIMILLDELLSAMRSYANHVDKDNSNKVRKNNQFTRSLTCLLYTSPSPRDRQKSRMPSSA